MAYLEISSLKKLYMKSGQKRLIVDIAEFHLELGEQILLIGKSGLGKSTLLHLIAGLTSVSEGNIFIDGNAIHFMSESQRDDYRGKNIGMIFQKYHLLPGLTALENVMAGLILNGTANVNRAKEILTRLDLKDRMNDLPETLSSGQQQRVAIARALASNPKLILADEPTAGLDRENATNVLTLLKEECKRLNACLILVTHDEFVKKQFEKSIDLSELSKVSNE
jgi:putative ABC transport system ATP-binding protein